MKKAVLLLLIVLISSLAGAKGLPALSIEELDQHFFSGEKVERTILIKRKPTKAYEAVLSWESIVAPAVIERGRENINLGSLPESYFKVLLKMPDVKRRTDLIWKINVVIKEKLNTGREICYNLKHKINYIVFPNDIPHNIKNILFEKQIGIVDPKGELRKIIEHLDIPFTLLNSQLSLETFQGDLIIIGPDALTSEHLWNGLLLLEDKGLSVLCFSHKKQPKFPLPIEASDEAPILVLRISAFTHPVFQEIKERDLSNWRVDGIIGRYLFQLPVGNFRALVRTDLPDNAASPLIELQYDEGKFIFCQLPVIEKFMEEPIARLLFENLIRYSLIEQDVLTNLVETGRDLSDTKNQKPK